MIFTEKMREPGKIHLMRDVEGGWVLGLLLGEVPAGSSKHELPGTYI